MKKVILESPYAGCIKKNIEYARLCVKDCLMRGEAPFASHLLYTQSGILNDEEPEERELGISAGFEWAEVADYTVVYCDFGISSGMDKGVQNALKSGKEVQYRYLFREINNQGL